MIKKSTLYESISQCDLVIEAVFEDIELKKTIFHNLDKLCKPESILATNTSTLDVDEIAASTNRPERILGLHFFSPANVMKLLEIVKHDSCSNNTIEAAQSIAESMGKESILVNDIPGFATSRLGVVLGNEAIRMLADGVASASDIDTAMRLGYRHPMGPLELTDLVGLDIRRDILNNLADSFNDEKYRPHPLLVRLVNEGSLGKKSGTGIYDWSSGEREERDLKL